MLRVTIVLNYFSAWFLFSFSERYRAKWSSVTVTTACTLSGYSLFLVTFITWLKSSSCRLACSCNYLRCASVTCLLALRAFCWSAVFSFLRFSASLTVTWREAGYLFRLVRMASIRIFWLIKPLSLSFFNYCLREVF